MRTWKTWIPSTVAQFQFQLDGLNGKHCTHNALHESWSLGSLKQTSSNSIHLMLMSNQMCINFEWCPFLMKLFLDMIEFDSADGLVETKHGSGSTKHAEKLHESLRWLNSMTVTNPNVQLPPRALKDYVSKTRQTSKCCVRAGVEDFLM